MPLKRGVFEIFSTGCDKSKDKHLSCRLWKVAVISCKTVKLSLCLERLKFFKFFHSASFPQPPVLHGFQQLKCNIFPGIVNLAHSFRSRYLDM